MISVNNNYAELNNTNSTASLELQSDNKKALANDANPLRGCWQDKIEQPTDHRVTTGLISTDIITGKLTSPEGFLGQMLAENMGQHGFGQKLPMGDIPGFTDMSHSLTDGLSPGKDDFDGLNPDFGGGRGWDPTAGESGDNNIFDPTHAGPDVTGLPGGECSSDMSASDWAKKVGGSVFCAGLSGALKAVPVAGQVFGTYCSAVIDDALDDIESSIDTSARDAHYDGTVVCNDNQCEVVPTETDDDGTGENPGPDGEKEPRGQINWTLFLGGNSGRPNTPQEIKTGPGGGDMDPNSNSGGGYVGLNNAVNPWDPMGDNPTPNDAQLGGRFTPAYGHNNDMHTLAFLSEYGHGNINPLPDL